MSRYYVTVPHPDGGRCFILVDAESPKCAKHDAVASLPPGTIESALMVNVYDAETWVSQRAEGYLSACDRPHPTARVAVEENARGVEPAVIVGMNEAIRKAIESPNTEQAFVIKGLVDAPAKGGPFAPGGFVIPPQAMSELLATKTYKELFCSKRDSWVVAFHEDGRRRAVLLDDMASSDDEASVIKTVRDAMKAKRRKIKNASAYRRDTWERMKASKPGWSVPEETLS